MWSWRVNSQINPTRPAALDGVPTEKRRFKAVDSVFIDDPDSTCRELMIGNATNSIHIEHYYLKHKLSRSKREVDCGILAKRWADLRSRL
jgi:hypothetical protein